MFSFTIKKKRKKKKKKTSLPKKCVSILFGSNQISTYLLIIKKEFGIQIGFTTFQASKSIKSVLKYSLDETIMSIE